MGSVGSVVKKIGGVVSGAPGASRLGGTKIGGMLGAGNPSGRPSGGGAFGGGLTGMQPTAAPSTTPIARPGYMEMLGLSQPNAGPGGNHARRLAWRGKNENKGWGRRGGFGGQPQSGWMQAYDQRRAQLGGPVPRANANLGPNGI